jgi:hypothetical protein
MQMDINFRDFINLARAIVWPVVVVIVALIFRREVPKLAEAISGRLSSVSAAGLITLKFVVAEPAAKMLQFLDKIREPSSVGVPISDAPNTLLQLMKDSPPANYVVIDLRDGAAWLTSRLYLFAVVLPPALGLDCFVFVGNRDQVARYYLGIASPKSIKRALEKRQPWLRQARVEAQLTPLTSLDEKGMRQVIWYPIYNSDINAVLNSLNKGFEPDKWDLPQAEALEKIVHAFVNPIDLFGPGQVETFVNSFLQNPKVRRSHDVTAQDKDWVHLCKFDEHARWIKDERDLLDLIGDELRRELIVDNSTIDDRELEKAVLRRRGNFVAVSDGEGRFNRLIDRAALIERVAVGRNA